MSLSDITQNVRYYRTHRGSYEATKMFSAELAVGAVRRVQPYLPQFGTSVYDLKWDLLIVLDTCRVDALAAVTDEYEFLPDDIPALRSVGSKTREWMVNTFTDDRDEDMSDTAYVTFNSHSDELLDESDFAYLGEVWRSHWDAKRGGVPPRPITEYTIAAGRALDPDCLIAHYKQPHQPYVFLDGFDPTNKRDDDANDRSGVFGALIEGRFTQKEVWEAYIDELRWALDDVELLLENVDAERVAITADHGECFGEWGLYGHHGCLLVPELVRVPYVDSITADDTGEFDPTVSLDTTDTGADVNAQLRALGYK
jgi:hypothetical protein